MDDAAKLAAALKVARAARDWGNTILTIGIVIEILVEALWLEHAPPEILRGTTATPPLKRWHLPLLSLKGAFVLVAGLIVVIGLYRERTKGTKADEIVDQIRADQQALITDAEVRVAKLNKEAAQLRAETADKEQKLDEDASLLGNVFLPRRVTVEMGSEFAKLKTFAGTLVVIEVVPDLESIQLAIDIASAVKTAGWKVEPPTVLTIPQGYSLLGVRITTDDTKPKGTPLNDAAWTLSQYLSFGYVLDLRDLKIYSPTNIEASFVGPVTTEERSHPTWWPSGFSPPTNTVCVFVGRKDFNFELSNKEHLDRLSKNARNFFFAIEHGAMPK